MGTSVDPNPDLVGAGLGDWVRLRGIKSGEAGSIKIDPRNQKDQEVTEKWVKNMNRQK